MCSTTSGVVRLKNGTTMTEMVDKHTRAPSQPCDLQHCAFRPNLYVIGLADWFGSVRLFGVFVEME